MDWKKLALSLVLGSSLAVAGCGDDGGGGDTDGGNGDAGGGDEMVVVPPPPTPTGCDEPGDTEFYVVNVLNFATPDPETGYVPGFNLDSAATPPGGETGCGQADWSYDVNKDGTIDDWEMGIDNQLASLASTLESFLSLQDEVSAANIIILAEVSGINDFTNDTCVTTSLLLGELPAGVTAADLDGDMDGFIDPGNEFLVDPLSYDPVSGDPLIGGQGQIVDGRIQIGPLDLELNVDVDGMAISLTVRDATVAFDITGDTLTDGVIGGGLNIDELIDAVGGALGGSIDPGTIRGILEPVADLDPNAEGVCQSVSVGLTFGAVDAIDGGDATGGTDGGV